MTIEEILFDLYLNYAKRALLGGGKGQYVMMRLRQENEELYRQVIRRAKDELDKTNVSQDREQC